MKHISHILESLIAEKNFEDQQRLIRISMTEDFMKCKRLLCGWGLAEHQDYLTEPWKVFCFAYDMELEELDKAIEALNAEAGRYVKEIHFPNGRWTNTEPPQPEF